MEHAEAQQNEAAERYLLGEMTDAERDEFEEHFFDCRICAEDVRDGERLMMQGRAAQQASNVVTMRPRRSSAAIWLPLAAAVAIVIGVVIPHRSPSPSLDVLQPQMIAASESRAAAPQVTTVRAGEPALLYVDVPPDPPFPRYEIVLRDAAGKTVAGHSVTAQQTKESLSLLLRSLPAGSYVLAIEGVREEGNRTEVAKHRVEVR